MLNVLDIFSGIGAFSLGLERTGAFRTLAFCEVDPFAQRVLRKHWPGVPIYDDVRSLTAARLRADGIVPDVICGGWPCQPHSVAGTRQGSADERDLWPEFSRLIREIRPRWVLGENVPGLLSTDAGRFFGDLLRDLASLGYDAEWDCIPASAVGAPHLRDRIWLVAYPQHPDPDSLGLHRAAMHLAAIAAKLRHAVGGGGEDAAVADPDQGRWGQQRQPQHAELASPPGAEPDGRGAPRWRDGQDVADTDSLGAEHQFAAGGNANPHERDMPAGRGAALADPDSGGWREQGDVDAAAAVPAARQSGHCGEVVDADDTRRREPQEDHARPGEPRAWQSDRRAVGSPGSEVPLAGGARLALGPGTPGEWPHAATPGGGGSPAQPRLGGTAPWTAEGLHAPWGPGWEDGTPRVVTSEAEKQDRRKRLIALGNSLVPQIPELLGKAIVEAT